MLFYCYDNEFSIKQDTQKYKTNHKWNVNEEAKNLKENHTETLFFKIIWTI